MRDDSARRTRWFPAIVLVLLLAVLAAGTTSNLRRNPQPELVAEGIPGRQALGRTTGRLPSNHPELVRHALADLDALTLPSGATLAGWDGPWRFVWPRDASFVAAARCSVGEYDEAARVLAYLNKVRPTEGRWAARYRAESATPVQDGREAQLDGSGWVLWASWFCAISQPDPETAQARLRANWPMLRESGDQIVAELGDDGLPATSPDYWERHEPEVTLGTAAPLLAGLRAGLAAADLLGRTAEVDTWRTALARLTTAVDHAFAPDYPRTPARSLSVLSELGGATGNRGASDGTTGIGGGADAIVTVLGPPFAPPRADVSAAIERSHRLLTLPNGGVTPGQAWRADGVAWTPQTALFGLSAAARGDRTTAESVLAWLDAHRTATGALPEKVNREGRLAGEAPLGWTCALVVLTAAALDSPLPTPDPSN